MHSMVDYVVDGWGLDLGLGPWVRWTEIKESLYATSDVLHTRALDKGICVFPYQVHPPPLACFGMDSTHDGVGSIVL